MAETFCTRCGTPGSGAFCADCGQPRDPALAHPAPAVPELATSDIRHGMPALLSFFIPSLGQLVKGDIGTAMAIIGIFCGLVMLGFAGLAMFTPLGVIVLWVWQIYNAYTAPDGQAKRARAGR